MKPWFLMMYYITCKILLKFSLIIDELNFLLRFTSLKQHNPPPAIIAGCTFYLFTVIFQFLYPSSIVQFFIGIQLSLTDSLPSGVLGFPKPVFLTHFRFYKRIFDCVVDLKQIPDWVIEFLGSLDDFTFYINKKVKSN